MKIIDTHCHLDYLQSENNLDVVVELARKNSVEKMVTISTKTCEFDEKILPIISKYSNVFASIGTHPDNADSLDFEEDSVIEICENNKKIIAIGETGLDFYRDENPMENVQIEMLERHVNVAKKRKIPIIFHSRNAERQTICELERLGCGESFSCIMHCFSGSEWFAKKCLDLGCYLSFSGIVTFKSAANLLEIAKSTPIEKIIIETDAPFLAPTPHRGKQNEPAFLLHTAEFLAKNFDMDLKKFCSQIWKNSHKIFNLKD